MNLYVSSARIQFGVNEPEEPNIGIVPFDHSLSTKRDIEGFVEERLSFVGVTFDLCGVVEAPSLE